MYKSLITPQVIHIYSLFIVDKKKLIKIMIQSYKTFQTHFLFL